MHHTPARSHSIRIATVLFVFLLLPLTVAAQTVQLPLQLPASLLQNALRSEFALQSEQGVEIFREGECRRVVVEGLNLNLAADQVQVVIPAQIDYGPDLFGGCFAAVRWQGTAEFQLQPYITPDDQLRYRLLDVQWRNADGGRTLTGQLAWTVLKRVMQPRLESFQIDLKPPRRELADILQAFLPPERSREIDAILASARPLEVQVEADGIRIPLAFELPDSYLQQHALADGQSEAPLDQTELEQFAATAQAWDAFLVFVIKKLGLDLSDTGTRSRLADLLLENRYETIMILAGEERPRNHQDPTRQLFLRSWNELRQLVLEAGRRGRVRGEVLAYLTLLNAGDALNFLDNTAPGLGIEISVDGLRRLARSLQTFADPGSATLPFADPLQYDWTPDPFLQELFELPEPPADDTPGADLQSRWQRLLEWLITSAHAADSSTDVQQLSTRLQGWVPDSRDLPAYRNIMAALLETTLRREIRSTELAAAEQAMVRHMVPATALIESCWRQYVRGQEGVTYLRSPSGSIGLMQINPAVWRGVFDVERLKTDPGYNAHAGTRILLRYLRQYARPVAAETGNPEDIARASYAAYNAGPRAAKRFLNPELKTTLRQIDAKFWNIYQGLSQGGEVDLHSCSVNATG